VTLKTSEFVSSRPKQALVCLQSVEGLYCKRPIQCLASSKILTPLLVRGEDTLAGWKKGGGTIIFSFLSVQYSALLLRCTRHM
jgi:hypothetical protein